MNKNNFYNLLNQERQQLKLCLDYCFVDKNKDVRGFLAFNMEYLADRVKGNIDHKNLEQFHEFIRGYTDIFTSNIYARKDFTYHNLCGIIQNKNIAVVKGDFNNNFHNDERYKDMQVDSTNQHFIMEQLKPTNLKRQRTLL